jgi:hypothetical protein
MMEAILLVLGDVLTSPTFNRTTDCPLASHDAVSDTLRQVIKPFITLAVAFSLFPRPAKNVLGGIVTISESS